jgi:D-lactate dehydrogenase (cytochrome)
MAVSENLLDAIRKAVGPGGWIDDEVGMEPYLVEPRGLWRGTCAMIARPDSTEAVAAVVRLCAEAGVAIVPQGGNTGLVGGGVPDGGIVLSTARLNRIRDVDAANHTMTVEAGCILAEVQDAALEAGALFPLSLGAEGSCQIGGNFATNAGGVAVLRYGNARDLVLGLEVVLPDGRIWNGLRGLRKDNTGYDLKQLFIGSEGTLGIITAIVLKLFPPPRVSETALAAMADVERVLTLFTRVRDECGDALSAFEMISRIALEFTVRHIPDVADPLDSAHAYYTLIELTSPRSGDNLRESLETVLAAALEDGTIEDAVIAKSQSQCESLWRIREFIPEAQKSEGGSVKHDISVPVSKVPEFIHRASQGAVAMLPGTRVVSFGHVGDGNIHFNLSQPVGADADAFLARWDDFNQIVFDITFEMGGSFSAEHGIGQLKRKHLVHYKSEVEVDLMRRLKMALDPDDILNPGKLV